MCHSPGFTPRLRLKMYLKKTEKMYNVGYNSVIIGKSNVENYKNLAAVSIIYQFYKLSAIYLKRLQRTSVVIKAT